MKAEVGPECGSPREMARCSVRGRIWEDIERSNNRNGLPRSVMSLPSVECSGRDQMMAISVPTLSSVAEGEKEK